MPAPAMPDSDWLKPVSAGVASKVALSPRRRIVVAWCCSDVVSASWAAMARSPALIKRSAGFLAMPLAIT
ncbi:Uncharacterised protein [Mycobacterium tuberculosis]|uniref:Uncharacterized protein n=1 Tax=Mycobacterium tuberculosis TaxID=1773 RepID=A0A0U0QTN6_MYCTX|nr:Uncharacterised protein [Mycobacterium tuberculosis]COU92266.1 Uncharacterised protein [Mycobacterium tuberculosis]COV36643.1 Uncharacterised protein [Mycobacterium tuberculosis]